MNTYLAQIQTEKLRQQLKEGAICRAKRDRQLGDDWFPLEEEAWQTNRRDHDIGQLGYSSELRID
jgi:CopG family transcriptional regulator / antitoxin EndoAI